MKFRLFATEDTADFMNNNGIKCDKVYKISTKKEPGVLALIEKGNLDLIINIPTRASDQESKDGYIIRRMAVDLNIPLITNRQLAESFIMAFAESQGNVPKLKSVRQYVDNI